MAEQFSKGLLLIATMESLGVCANITWYVSYLFHKRRDIFDNYTYYDVDICDGPVKGYNNNDVIDYVDDSDDDESDDNGDIDADDDADDEDFDYKDGHHHCGDNSSSSSSSSSSRNNSSSSSSSSSNSSRSTINNRNIIMMTRNR